MNKELESAIKKLRLNILHFPNQHFFNEKELEAMVDAIRETIEPNESLSALQQPKETSEEILDEIHDTFFDKRFFPKSSWKKVWRDKYIILKRQQE